MIKNNRPRPKKQPDMHPPYQEPEFEPPESHEPEFEPPEFHEPEFDPPEFHEPEFDPPESHEPEFEPEESEPPQFHPPPPEPPEFEPDELDPPPEGTGKTTPGWPPPLPLFDEKKANPQKLMAKQTNARINQSWARRQRFINIGNLPAKTNTHFV
jgi:hypothetical protein